MAHKFNHLNKLLERKAWSESVFRRDKYLCVVCGNKAVDAHHLIERKLFPDGGYYIDNGVSVCEDCHWGAERTDISAVELRLKAGIKEVVLPPNFSQNQEYDKWGNIVVSATDIIPGPLAESEQVHKIMRHKLRFFRTA